MPHAKNGEECGVLMDEVWKVSDIVHVFMLSIFTFPAAWFSDAVNSLCPSDAIWRYRSGSRLALVMACCLMAPSHYPNQCWLIISQVLWHSSEGNFTGNVWDISPWYELQGTLSIQYYWWFSQGLTHFGLFGMEKQCGIHWVHAL